MRYGTGSSWERHDDSSDPSSDTAWSREPEGFGQTLWDQPEDSGEIEEAPLAQAIGYVLNRWDGFACFLDDGRVCLTNNAAERALGGLALDRKAWLFAGSQRAAVMYTLTGTAKLNDLDPQAWLADVLARIADTPQGRLSDLLPRNLEGAICEIGRMSHADHIVRIRIQPDDWRPTIWRRAEVPSSAALKAVHEVIRIPPVKTALRAECERRKSWGSS